MSASAGRTTARTAVKAKVDALAAGEFMRRFLLHVLPDGFHRIRHYGLFANGHRADKLALCRKLLAAPSTLVNRDGEDHDRGRPRTPTRHPVLAAVAE